MFRPLFEKTHRIPENPQIFHSLRSWRSCATSCTSRSFRRKRAASTRWGRATVGDGPSSLAAEKWEKHGGFNWISMGISWGVHGDLMVISGNWLGFYGDLMVITGILMMEIWNNFRDLTRNSGWMWWSTGLVGQTFFTCFNSINGGNPWGKRWFGDGVRVVHQLLMELLGPHCSP